MTDDAVWAAYEILRDEIERWRVIEFQPKIFFATRDVFPLTGPTEPVEITQEIERIQFSDETTAKRYVLWRALKAALLSQEK